MPQAMTPDEEQKFAKLVGRIFSDEKFAQQMEANPEQALQQAGYQLNTEQRSALTSAAQRGAPDDAAAVAAFVRPVVSVLTKGTRPVVSVVTSSSAVTVVTAAPGGARDAKDDKDR